MRFLADESVDRSLSIDSAAMGTIFVYVAELAPGTADSTILATANTDQRVLITADKDFGELVFRMHQSHAGVLLLRIAGLSAVAKADVLSAVVAQHGGQLPGAFAVADPTVLRIRQPDTETST